MNRSTTIDAHFMEMANPLLSEFGFPSVKALVKEQLCLMLQAKISHYAAESRIYESRCGGTYMEVSTLERSSGEESFEMDDLLNDWRFAREAEELYSSKLKDIENA